MTKIKLIRMAKKAGWKFSKIIPNVLSYIGAAGVVGTAVVTAIETPKAIEVYKDCHADDPEGSISFHTIKETSLCYIPAAATGALTIGCILGGNRLHRKHYARLLGSYKDLANRYRDYKIESKKVLGEAGAAAVASAVAAKNVPENKVPKQSEDHDGQELFYLPYYDHVFWSDWKTVMSADSMAQKELGIYNYTSLEDYTKRLGIAHQLNEDMCEEEHYWSYYWLEDSCWCYNQGVPITYDENFRLYGKKVNMISFDVDPEIAEFAFPEGSPF